MTKHLLLAAGVALLGACGDHGGRRVTVETPPSYTTDLLVQATNYDGSDYALWLEWQDGTGAWNQIYLFSLYADPAVGPTTNFEMLVATPGVPYTVILSDPFDGYVYDTAILWLPYGTSSDIRFQVIGGVLVRPS
jgi:hypothetical protein